MIHLTWTTAYFGELIGTLLLVLLGNGACFAVSHKKMFANQPGKWVIVCLGWAAAIFVGAFTASALGSGGYINPAISLYATIAHRDWHYFVYIPFQLIGAFIGQWLLYLLNWKFIANEAEELDGDKTATRGSSCTNPAFDGSKNFGMNFGYEFIGTAVLVLVVFLMQHSIVALNGGVMAVTITITAIAMGLGSATGFALNPARDLMPRLAYQTLRLTNTGKQLVSANWAYSWIQFVAPFAAGLLFGLIGLAF